MFEDFNNESNKISLKKLNEGFQIEIFLDSERETFECQFNLAHKKIHFWELKENRDKLQLATAEIKEQ